MKKANDLGLNWLNPLGKATDVASFHCFYPTLKIISICGEI